jgi:hypothetical protein
VGRELAAKSSQGREAALGGSCRRALEPCTFPSAVMKAKIIMGAIDEGRHYYLAFHLLRLFGREYRRLAGFSQILNFPPPFSYYLEALANADPTSVSSTSTDPSTK